jgi:LDH2 family malate/lactate/ureidoglycolate dehydrogenase
MDKDQFTTEVALEFHRRVAAIIAAVQAGMWKHGVHDLLGYATDFAVGEARGRQTLVLKSRSRSSYVRLQWETILGDGPAGQLVDDAIQSAINELA